jgi:hypothetical protein
MLMSTRIKQTEPEPEPATPPNLPFAPPEVTATGAAPVTETEENI